MCQSSCLRCTYQHATCWESRQDPCGGTRFLEDWVRQGSVRPTMGICSNQPSRNNDPQVFWKLLTSEKVTKGRSKRWSKVKSRRVFRICDAWLSATFRMPSSMRLPWGWSGRSHLVFDRKPETQHSPSGAGTTSNKRFRAFSSLEIPSTWMVLEVHRKRDGRSPNS